MGWVGLLGDGSRRELELVAQASLVPPPEQVPCGRAHVGGGGPPGIEVRGIKPSVRTPPQLRAQLDAEARPFHNAGREKPARLDPVVAVGEPPATEGRGGDCGVFEITSAGEIAPLPLVQIFALNRGISLSPGTIKKGGGAENACSESRTDLPSFPTIYGRR